MARVLITSIGTGSPVSNTKDLSDARASGKYRQATYLFDDGKEYKKTFFADALIEHYNFERVYVLGTAKSMWDQLYDSFSGVIGDEDYYLELAVKIEDSSHSNYLYERSFLKPIEISIDNKLGKSGSKCYLIKYGLTRQELLDNFNILVQIGEHLCPDDEVYVDITHSFRSLAIFQYMMISFLENLADKKISIAKIVYGMMDVSREMGGKSPVVDLTVVNELNHWIKGIYELENYGNGYMVAGLLKEHDSELAVTIRDFTDRINMNYLSDVSKEKTSGYWQGLKEIEGPGKFAASTIKKFLKRFKNDPSDAYFQLGLAKWLFEQKRYAAGYLTLTEAIVTKLCENRTVNNENWEDRQTVKKDFMGKKYEYLHGLGELLREVNDIRRLVAHSQGGSENQYRSAVANCIRYCDNTERAFKLIDKTSR